MGSILWLYQTKELIIICAPVTDVIWYSYTIEDTKANHKKKKKKKMLFKNNPVLKL